MPCLAQQVFQLFGADSENVGRTLFLVDLVVFSRVQLRDESIDGDVKIGAVLERAGNDQRRARFVDQNRVDFVDDRDNCVRAGPSGRARYFMLSRR